MDRLWDLFVQGALEYFAKGIHIGKVLVAVEDGVPVLPSRPQVIGPCGETWLRIHCEWTTLWRFGRIEVCCDEVWTAESFDQDMVTQSLRAAGTEEGVQIWHSSGWVFLSLQFICLNFKRSTGFWVW